MTAHNPIALAPLCPICGQESPDHDPACDRREVHHWHAGYNLAGYLPESDPFVTESLTDAVQYLRDTIERWQDEDAILDDPDPATADERIEHDSSGADGWYKDTHLWVTPCPDAACLELTEW